jgi:hypothetical protein
VPSGAGWLSHSGALVPGSVAVSRKLFILPNKLVGEILERGKAPSLSFSPLPFISKEKEEG